MPWCSMARKMVFRTMQEVMNRSNSGSVTMPCRKFCKRSQGTKQTQQPRQHPQFLSTSFPSRSFSRSSVPVAADRRETGHYSQSNKTQLAEFTKHSPVHKTQPSPQNTQHTVHHSSQQTFYKTQKTVPKTQQTVPKTQQSLQET